MKANFWEALQRKKYLVQYQLPTNQYFDFDYYVLDLSVCVAQLNSGITVVVGWDESKGQANTGIGKQ